MNTPNMILVRHHLMNTVN